MALVKRWAIATLGACLALAIAYLPPRGARSSRRSAVFTAQAPRGTPARLEAQALADQWRAADGAVRLLAQRQAFRAAVRRDSGVGSGRGPLVVFDEPARATPVAARIVDSAMVVAWQGLGLGETKVRVGVVIELALAEGVRDRPLYEQATATYLAPDSTDRTTCIAFLPSGYWTRAFADTAPTRIVFDQLVQSFKSGLGPCAFYAAFGTPGKPVRRWLVARNWDVALTLDAAGHARGDGVGWLGDPRFAWYWDAVYSLPPATVACLASRPAGCRAAVVWGASEDLAIPVPDIMRVERRWWRVQNLVAGQRFLADLAHAVGRERFMTFWTSTLPVDTALSAALKRPVGEWTMDWEQTFVPPIRLGPAPPVGAIALAVLLAVLAVALIALTASRRQVR